MDKQLTAVEVEEIDTGIYDLCKVRDRLRQMLEATYEGANHVLKTIPGSGSRYSTKQRKTTLKEARVRIARSVDELNRIINTLDKWRRSQES